MTVFEIVKEYLETNGFDGLCGDECGCGIDDFMPCCEVSVGSCEPGYKVLCKPEDCADCGADACD